MTSKRRFSLLMKQVIKLKERNVIDRFEVEFSKDRDGDITFFKFNLERGEEKDKENYRSFTFYDVADFDEIVENGDLENFWFMK